MKTKLLVVAFVVLALAFSVAAAEAYAFDHGGERGRHSDLEKKFYKKAHFLLSNKEEIGLSDEQAKKIKELKMQTKKDLIRKDAEIEILALDIKAEMYEDPINTGAINKLIDKKYDFKKEKAKALVAACASLKGILTKEQKEKMKELSKKCEEKNMRGQMMQCPMMGENR